MHMDEKLRIENVFLNHIPSTLILTTAGLALKDAMGKVTTIYKENISSADIFYGLQEVTLRLNNSIIISGLEIIMEEKIKEIITQIYNVNVRKIDLDIYDTLSGFLVPNKDFLTFYDEKIKFEIPINSIESVYNLKNDTTITLNNQNNTHFTSELVFYTTNELDINAKNNELITFEDIQTISPRAKMNYVFFNDHFKMIGPSNTFKVNYSDIEFIISINEYLSLKISPIKLGETLYEFVAIKFDDSIVEFELENITFEGKIGDSFLNLLRKYSTALVIKTTQFGYRCVYKALEGTLYLLNDGIFYLPKPLFIPTNEILSAEYSRANFSLLTSKTFDMRVQTNDFLFRFDGINKEMFSFVEKFFADNNIKTTSEVLVEQVESESEYESEEESSDDDSFISD